MQAPFAAAVSVLTPNFEEVSWPVEAIKKKDPVVVCQRNTKGTMKRYLPRLERPHEWTVIHCWSHHKDLWASFNNTEDISHKKWCNSSPPSNSTHANTQQKIKKTGGDCTPPSPSSPTSLRRAQRKGSPRLPTWRHRGVATKNAPRSVAIIGSKEQFFSIICKLKGARRVFKSNWNAHEGHRRRFVASGYRHQIHSRAP